MHYYQHLTLRTFMQLKRYQSALGRRGLLRQRNTEHTAIRFGAAPVKTIPRNIFIFWAQGLDQAPELVRTCVDSWRDMNPDWEVQVMSQSDVEGMVAMDDIPSDLSWAAYADILRLRLLREYGGVWVDATVLCERPLDEWLSHYLSEEFFVFFSPHPDREIASWFITAGPDSFLLGEWSDMVTSYWQRATKPDAYIWLHYIFEYLKLTRKDFRTCWSKVPKVQPIQLILANRLITNRLPNGVTKSDVLALRGRIPLAKLTYKHNASLDAFEHYVARGV